MIDHSSDLGLHQHFRENGKLECLIQRCQQLMHYLYDVVLHSPSLNSGLAWNLVCPASAAIVRPSTPRYGGKPTTVKPSETASNCDLGCVFECLCESACEQNTLGDSPYGQRKIHYGTSRIGGQSILRVTANCIEVAIHSGSPIITHRWVVHRSIRGGVPRPSFHALSVWIWLPIQERRPPSQLDGACHRKSIA